jgi:TP901 family phage tail tape measure protein
MSSWLGVSSLGMLVGREIRQMFSDVVKLDEALVDLKKTFQGTSQDLQEFYHESNNIAKQLGVTTEEVISQASSWSRLGYSTKETAIEMAKLSSEMALISPGLSTEDAQSGLVSIMKAYSVEVDDVTRKILDNINIIGNNFATSNAEIITGLQKSSAAMAAMGSTFEENISLFTAGQSIIQDASTVGNALRSISLRIRGSIFVASICRNVYAA